MAGLEPWFPTQIFDRLTWCHRFCPIHLPMLYKKGHTLYKDPGHTQSGRFQRGLAACQSANKIGIHLYHTVIKGFYYIFSIVWGKTEFRLYYDVWFKPLQRCDRGQVMELEEGKTYYSFKCKKSKARFSGVINQLPEVI